MASLVESIKYGAVNTTGTAINGLYVIMFTLEAYKIQDNKIIDGKIYNYWRISCQSTIYLFYAIKY